MKNRTIRSLMIPLLALALVFCPAALSESYTAGTMRLLHCEGAVEILDATGAPRFIMENVRFDSGETLVTGADGIAAVSLDTDRIVTLDSDSRAIFEKQANAMKLTLTEGALLLDVQKKLDPNETLDIQTSTMTVGIRGTIVYVTEQPSVTGDGVQNTLGVLEGTAVMTYVNPNGVRQAVEVSRGQVATLEGTSAAEPMTNIRVKPLTPQDVPDFVTNLPDALPDTNRRVEENIARLGEEDDSPDYPADGSWTWNEPVTLIAQSASKLYDGQPLTRPSDVLVYGLPAQCTIHVTAHGEITYPGFNTNSVGDYAIYNAAGKDVTSHFTNIKKVNGRLVVDPAPLTIWTGSAEKVYDGTPLTDPDAGIRAHPGYEKNTTPWRNLSYVQTTATDAQVLLGMCGVTWVHGTNPLTEETKEIALRAGEKLTVVLNDDGEGKSIDFKVEKLYVEEIPDEALRLYARNPEVLAQACRDAGWDAEALAERIAQLDRQDDALVSRHGLEVADEEADRLMVDCTNVRITVDTDITSYNDRALGSEEAHYSPVNIPEDIHVTATGSQTEVGQSPNTYDIDWGSSDPGYYILQEELGTLTVTALEKEAPVTYDDAVTLTAASASKVYDGTPLTDGSFIVTGLPAGYTATATVTGSQTDAGTSNNTLSNVAILDANDKDVTSQFTNLTTASGMLTVTPATATVTTGSASRPYDGTALTGGEAAITGLVGGESAAVTAIGSITDVGTADNTYAIDWGSTNSANYTISENLGTLEVTLHDEEVTFTAASISKTYDGTPLSVAFETAPTSKGVPSGKATTQARSNKVGRAPVTIAVRGLPEELSFTARASASQINAGSCTYDITDLAILDADGADVTRFFTNIKTIEGTLTVDPAEVTITTGSASKTYDGMALTGGEATITGLVGGETATVIATGWITDAGTVGNTYAIDWGTTNKGNYTVTESLGTLEVAPLPVSFDLGGYTSEFDGDVKLPDGLSCDIADAEDMEVLIGAIEQDVGVTATFALPGGRVRLDVYSFEDVGSHTLSPEVQFLSGKAGNYAFTYTNTAMVITPMVINVRLHDGTDITYNGEEQLGRFSATCSLFDWDIGYQLSDGERGVVWGSDRITVTVSGGGRNVGEYTLKGSYAIDAENPSNYSVIINSANMKIVPAPLTVATGSASKQFDGTALTCDEASLTGLVESDTAEVTATGSQTEVGESPNTYAIEWGTTLPGNYAVMEALGTLTVETAPMTVIIRTGSLEKVYDGTPLKGGSITVEGLPEGYNYAIAGGTLTGSRTDAGESDNTIDINGISIIDGDGMSIDKSTLNIVVVLGKLTVTPAPLTVYTASASEVYHEGVRVTAEVAELDGLVGGETAEAYATGVLTEVGSCPNTYAIEWGTAKPGNYAITEVLGTLIVIPASKLEVPIIMGDLPQSQDEADPPEAEKDGGEADPPEEENADETTDNGNETDSPEDGNKGEPAASTEERATNGYYVHAEVEPSDRNGDVPAGKLGVQPVEKPKSAPEADLPENGKPGEGT